jgi:NTP pyrophosphatase (non-canonical NTP hydrolase)
MNNTKSTPKAAEALISQETYRRIAKFNQDRNWDQFHTPKDLAISISLEAAELLECFQWSGADMHVDKKKEKITEETADIIIYALQMCQVLGIDPEEIIKNKLIQNEQKYPADKAYGNALKYTELQKLSENEYFKEGNSK